MPELGTLGSVRGDASNGIPLYVGFAGRSIISGLWQGSGQPVHRLGIEAWRRDCGPAPYTLLIRLDGILGRIAPDPAYKVDEQQTLPSIFL